MAMSTDHSFGERWAGLAALPPARQQAAMGPILDDVLRLEAKGRRAAMVDMVNAEYGLDEAALHRFTASRLRAWLALAADHLHAAETIAEEYDDVFDALPGAIAMRRTMVMQSVARSALAPDEIARLTQVSRSILG